jgi:hypothetical protein
MAKTVKGGVAEEAARDRDALRVDPEAPGANDAVTNFENAETFAERLCTRSAASSRSTTSARAST